MLTRFSHDASVHAIECLMDTAVTDMPRKAVMKRGAGDTSTYRSAQRLAKHTSRGRTVNQDTVAIWARFVRDKLGCRDSCMRVLPHAQ